MPFAAQNPPLRSARKECFAPKGARLFFSKPSISPRHKADQQSHTGKMPKPFKRHSAVRCRKIDACRKASFEAVLPAQVLNGKLWQQLCRAEMADCLQNTPCKAPFSFVFREKPSKGDRAPLFLGIKSRASRHFSKLTCIPPCLRIFALCVLFAQRIVDGIVFTHDRSHASAVRASAMLVFTIADARHKIKFF